MEILSYLNICIVISIVCFTGVFTDCPPANLNDGTVTDYMYIDPQNYDRNYSEYSENRRPLGYDKATIYYGEDYVNPCIKVTDAKNRMVEVMIETTPSSDICIKRSKNAEIECGNDVFRRCGMSSAATTYIELLCPNCGESDINVWYRIRMSDKNDPDIENWCSDQTLEYPRDLKTVTLPPDFTFPAVDDKDNFSPGLNSNIFLITLIWSIMSFIVM